MTSPFPVVVNRNGGAAKRAGEGLAEQIEAAFAAAGLVADVHAVEGRAIASTVEKLASAGAVAVGGGDGTHGCAAAVLAKAGAIHGVLPLGTRNHLARQLGIPLDLAGAAKVIAGGHETLIDLSEVNGRTFINNASIGLYPKLVTLRDKGQKRGMPKWVANIPAAWAVLEQMTHHRFRLVMDDAPQPVVTPLLFVGNNVYSLDAGKVGTRDALDDGKLSVFAVARSTRWGLVRFALRTLAGRSDATRDFATIGTCARLTINAHRSRISLALDGEVVTLSTPLDFTVRERALRVFAPPPN